MAYKTLSLFLKITLQFRTFAGISGINNMNKKKTTTRKKATKKKQSIFARVFKTILLSALLGAILVGLFVCCVYYGMWGKIPDYRDLKEIRNNEASSLYSEDGELLGKYYVENRTNVMFGSISRNAVNALIATEDVRFYEHHGFDKVSMLRVLFKTLLLGDKSSGGGSTISQQLAKNLYPRQYSSRFMIPVIKIKEIITAHRLEKLYTKDEILTLYLNTVSFGEGTFGIESAAQKYFSTTATRLSVPEAATLIGLLKGPSYYNPRVHPDRTLQRRNTVIAQMVKYDYLTEEEGEELKKEKLRLRFKPLNHYSGLAPYLREQIRQDAVKLIAEFNEANSTNYDLYKDGLKLVTTIDAEMQRYAEKAMQQHMKSLQHAFYTHLGKQEPWDKEKNLLDNAIRESEVYKNLKRQGLGEKAILAAMNEKKPMTIYSAYQGETEMQMSSIDSIKHYLKILQPGMIAVEPQSGKIKVWIGGLDFKYFQYDQVLAPRQVGSVFKPVVYSAAIEHGARVDAYYNNEQKSYPEYDNWTPRNSNNQYGGYYTLKGALSQSVNTIAVQVLLQTGIDATIEHARRLGIQSELPAVPSIALGTANIPLREMILPYLCYANNGVSTTPYYLLSIKDRDGRILYEAEPTRRERVIPAEQAHIMSSMLSAVIQEGTGKRLINNYGLNIPLAGKTGTTQNQADGWFIGYNPRIVVGVRVGANNSRVHFNSTALGQGANMALPIFGLFIQECLQSNTYAYWSGLSFPVPPVDVQKDLEVPTFKENINLLERLTNQKLEKVKKQDTEKDTDSPKKKGFFRKIGDLFKKKDKK